MRIEEVILQLCFWLLTCIKISFISFNILIIISVIITSLYDLKTLLISKCPKEKEGALFIVKPNRSTFEQHSVIKDKKGLAWWMNPA